MEKEILVIGDVHADKSSIEELELIFGEICFKEKWDRIIFLGDIYDKKRPCAEVLNFITKILTRMLKICPVDIVDGNHDSISETISLLDYSTHFGITLHKGETGIKIGEKTLGIGHFFCVSEDTECLSENGWKKYDELLLNEKIATYNIEKKMIEYQYPLRISDFNYKGEMYNFIHKKWSAIDALVTPNHNMVMETNWNKNIKIKKADGKLLGNNMVLNTDKWKYPISYRFNNKHWAELIGFIIGDGWYVKNKGKVYGICIGQKQGRNTEYLETLLKNCNLEYSKTYQTNNTKFKSGYNYEDFKYETFYIKKSNKKFINFINKKLYGKKLNRTLVSLPKSQLKLLFDGLINSDGTRYSDIYQVFYQKELQQLKLFEEICLKLGKKCTTRKHSEAVWMGHITNQQRTVINRNNIEKVDYDGIVWCPTTKNGTWVARRNGVAFITGNTDQGDQFKKDERHKVKELAKKYDLTLLGHDHCFRELAPNVFHLGSVVRQHFGESEYGVPKIAKISTESFKMELCDVLSAIPMIDVTSLKEALKTAPRTKLRLIFTSFETYMQNINKLPDLQRKFADFKIKHDYVVKNTKVNKMVKKGKSFEEMFAEFLKKEVENKDVQKLIQENL